MKMADVLTHPNYPGHSALRPAQLVLRYQTSQVKLSPDITLSDYLLALLVLEDISVYWVAWLMSL